GAPCGCQPSFSAAFTFSASEPRSWLSIILYSSIVSTCLLSESARPWSRRIYCLCESATARRPARGRYFIVMKALGDAGNTSHWQARTSSACAHLRPVALLKVDDLENRDPEHQKKATDISQWMIQLRHVLRQPAAIKFWDEIH